MPSNPNPNPNPNLGGSGALGALTEPEDLKPAAPSQPGVLALPDVNQGASQEAAVSAKEEAPVPDGNTNEIMPAPSTGPSRRKRTKSKDEAHVKGESEWVPAKSPAPPTPEQLRQTVLDNLTRCSTSDLESIAMLLGGSPARVPPIPTSLSADPSPSAPKPDAETQRPPSTDTKMPPAAATETTEAEKKQAADKQLTPEEIEEKKAAKRAVHARYMRFSRSLFSLIPGFCSSITRLDCFKEAGLGSGVGEPGI